MPILPQGIQRQKLFDCRHGLSRVDDKIRMLHEGFAQMSCRSLQAGTLFVDPLFKSLFVDAGLNRWYVARGASGQYSWDANVTVNSVLSLGSGAYICLVDDGDYYNPGFDFFAGFEVTVSGPGTEATCTVTIID